MFPSRYKEQIRDFARNSRFRRTVLGAIAVVCLVVVEFLSVFPPEYTIIAFLFIGILYLDILEEQTLSITKITRKIEDRSNTMNDDLENIIQRTDKIGDDLNPIPVYPHEDSVAPELQRIISEKTPEHVFMLDYSSKKGEYIVDAARKAGSEVFILIKNPNNAVRNYQRERIVGQLTHSLFAMFEDYDCLHVGLYNETGAVRARVLGEDHLCVGWYRYECTESDGDERIWGHNNPAFILSEDDQAFDDINRWLREEVLATHWENSTDLATLLESNDMPELERWVHEDSTTEQEVDRKREYIEQISGSSQHAQQVLFD